MSGSARRPSPWRWVNPVLLALFLLGAAAYVLLRPPEAPEPLTAEQRQAAEQALARTRDVLDAVRADAKAGKSHPFTVRLTEEEMNGFLESDPEAQRVLTRYEVERAWVRFSPGEVELNATRSTGGLGLTASAALLPQVEEDGSLGFKLERLKMGRLGMPDRVAEKVRAAVTGGMEAATKMLEGATVHTVHVEDKALVITGDTR